MPPKTKKKARKGAKQGSGDAMPQWIPSPFPSNSFQGLPYEIKRLVVRGTGLGLPDLSSLSHTCRLWHDVTIEEDLYTPYLKYLEPEVCTNFAKIINPPPTRSFIMLAARLNCMHCKTRPTHMIFVPLMLRLCSRCIVDEEDYEVASKSRAVTQYHLTQKDIASLLRLPYGEIPEGKKSFPGLSGEMVSLKLVKEVAIKKHGSTEESLEAHLAKQKRIAKQKWDEKMKAYDDRLRRPKDAQIDDQDPTGKKTPKHRPKEPEILKSPSIGFLTGYVIMNSVIRIGILTNTDRVNPSYKLFSSCRLCGLIGKSCREDDFALPGIPASDVSHITGLGSANDSLTPCKYRDSWTLDFRSRAVMADDELMVHVDLCHFEIARYGKCVKGCNVDDSSKVIPIGTCYYCCNSHALKEVFGPEALTREIWIDVEDGGLGMDNEFDDEFADELYDEMYGGLPPF